MVLFPCVCNYFTKESLCLVFLKLYEIVLLRSQAWAVYLLLCYQYLNIFRFAKYKRFQNVAIYTSQLYDVNTIPDTSEYKFDEKDCLVSAIYKAGSQNFDCARLIRGESLAGVCTSNKYCNLIMSQQMSK